ncbi:MAG: hypothetical protein GC156_11450 [Actinomycetales bacterium]|nr:hypothetical protein [Actinomycetales bacterium]
MSRNRTVAAIGAAALMGVALLAGCSSSSSSSSEATAAASDGSAQMLPPVIITADQTEATCQVGNNLDIVIPEADLAGTTVDSSDPAVVSVVQASEDATAKFNPGGTCVAVGSATITVTNKDNSTRDIAITVTE